MNITNSIDWEQRYAVNLFKIKTSHMKRNYFSKWKPSNEGFKQIYQNNQLSLKNEFQRKATKSDFICDGSFHEACKPVLLFAQLFGILPVQGILSNDINELKFSWYNLRTIYTLILILLMFLHNSLIIYWVYETDMSFDKTGSLIFHYSVLIITTKCVFLARKWPKLMKKWEIIEKQLPPLITIKDKNELAHKIRKISIIIGILSLVEHLLNILSQIHFAVYCNLDPNGDPIKNFFMGHLYYIFAVFEYSSVLAVFGKFLNLIYTFTWTYSDVFLIIISLGLTAKFKQINIHLVQMKGKIIYEPVWEFYRILYRNVCNLCEDMDKEISLLTMVSYCNNLHGLCTQLLRSMNTSTTPSIIHGIYFWLSLLFLIGRTLAVSLYLSDVNEESKRPLDVFRQVPKTSWCLTVNRFSNEVTVDIQALSGMKFFYITRGLILTVAGTIITYELILIQFHQVEEYVDCRANNGS